MKEEKYFKKISTGPIIYKTRVTRVWKVKYLDGRVGGVAGKKKNVTRLRKIHELSRLTRIGRA